MKFESRLEKINPGDVLLLLSDGLSELFNHDREMFEYARIKKLLLKNAEKTSAEIISELKNAAETWRHGAEQADDMTLVLVKRNENRGDAVSKDASRLREMNKV